MLRETENAPRRCIMKMMARKAKEVQITPRKINHKTSTKVIANRELFICPEKRSTSERKRKAASISYKVIWMGELSSASLAFKTAKIAASKAEVSPYASAVYSCVLKSPETKYIPATMIRLNANSTQEKGRPMIKGSNQETCRVVVAKQRIPREAVES